MSRLMIQDNAARLQFYIKKQSKNDWSDRLKPSEELLVS